MATLKDVRHSMSSFDTPSQLMLNVPAGYKYIDTKYMKDDEGNYNRIEVNITPEVDKELEEAKRRYPTGTEIVSWDYKYSYTIKSLPYRIGKTIRVDTYGTIAQIILNEKGQWADIVGFTTWMVLRDVEFIKDGNGHVYQIKRKC